MGDALPGHRPSCLSGSATHLQSSNAPEPHGTTHNREHPQPHSSPPDPGCRTDRARPQATAGGRPRAWLGDSRLQGLALLGRTSRGAAGDPAVARARSHARRPAVGGRDPNGSVSTAPSPGNPDLSGRPAKGRPAARTGRRGSGRGQTGIQASRPVPLTQAEAALARAIAGGRRSDRSGVVKESGGINSN